MEERVRFITEAAKRERPFSDLCSEFGISRRVGYKWLKRVALSGFDGLQVISRRPSSSPQRTPDSVVQLIARARMKHPKWGARTLINWLRPRHADVKFPAPSTCGEILKRLEFIRPRGKRSSRPERGGGYSSADYSAPNTTWCADFKGHFRTRDGAMCYPLTISDGFSRYIIRAQGVPGSRFRDVLPVFKSAFREFGLPAAIRTDNGPPFASCTLHGLSRLAVWWLKLGIRLDRIEPGKPQQNGRHERIHRTLKEAVVTPPKSSLRAQQSAFDAFTELYNHERPHQSLSDRPPATLYQRSPRAYCGTDRDPRYPKHFRVERTYYTGVIGWRRHGHSSLYVTTALAGQLLGLEPVSDGVWRVHFAGYQLGLIDERVGVRLLPTPLEPSAYAQTEAQPTGGPCAPRERRDIILLNNEETGRVLPMSPV